MQYLQNNLCLCHTPMTPMKLKKGFSLYRFLKKGDVISFKVEALQQKDTRIGIMIDDVSQGKQLYDEVITNREVQRRIVAPRDGYYSFKMYCQPWYADVPENQRFCSFYFSLQMGDEVFIPIGEKDPQLIKGYF